MIEGRLICYRDRIKQLRETMTFQNNERKFYLLLEGKAPDDKENNKRKRNIIEKAKWMNKIGKKNRRILIRS